MGFLAPHGTHAFTNDIMASMSRRTAVIAGGGIGGLAVGWALARYGWQVRVHERSPEIREIGAGILLMSNSISIF